MGTVQGRFRSKTAPFDVVFAVGIPPNPELSTRVWIVRPFREKNIGIVFYESSDGDAVYTAAFAKDRTFSSKSVPLNKIQAAVSNQYRLQFRNSLPRTLFTSSKIEAEGQKPVEIVIVDSDSKEIITCGPLSSIKVEILVLDGDFGIDGQEEWTEKEFGDSIVREREGKRPLLSGELMITLIKGVGCLGDANFTDNSSWTRSRRFRLGARVSQSRCIDRVQEAV
ncbi:hypothetical protein BHM03_00050330, partial [Ensete ventricosum]